MLPDAPPLPDKAPPPDKASLPDPSYHWTTCKVRVFLGALSDLGRVGEAARAVGMSRQSAYRLRERLGRDELFARIWDEARDEGRRQRAARRAKGEGAAARKRHFRAGKVTKWRAAVVILRRESDKYSRKATHSARKKRQKRAFPALYTVDSVNTPEGQSG